MGIKSNTMSSVTRFRFVLVTLFTTANLLLGLLSLFAAGTSYIWLAAWFILLCVLLDAFDGLLARRWEVVSPFGAQLDSLADMTSFIIGSGALAYYWVMPQPNSNSLVLIVISSALYVIAGAFRLARFGTSGIKSGYFQGMPTTMVAGMLATTYLVYPLLSWYWVVILVSLLAMLMISSIPYPKFGYAMPLIPNWCYLLILVGVVVNLARTSWVVMTGYLLSGPIIWLWQRRRF